MRLNSFNDWQYILKSARVIKIQTIDPSMMVSYPIKEWLFWGTSKRTEKIKIINNKIKATEALITRSGNDNICVRLMEIPTKINPVKVAAAAAVAK